MHVPSANTFQCTLNTMDAEMLVALLQCRSVTASEDVLTFSNLQSNVHVTN